MCRFLLSIGTIVVFAFLFMVSCLDVLVREVRMVKCWAAKPTVR